MRSDRGFASQSAAGVAVNWPRGARVFALLGAGVAVLSGLGLALGMPVLAGGSGRNIAMAPVTAGALALLSGAMGLSTRRADRGIQRGIAIVIGIVGLLGVLCLGQFVVGSLGGWLAGWPAGARNLLGGMSPLTAGVLVLQCASLALLRRPHGTTRAGIVAGLLAVGSLMVGYVVLLGYANDVPLLYDLEVVPMALSTAVAFVCLGMGLLWLAVPRSAMLQAWMGGSTRGRLLRAFLPAMLLVLVLENGMSVAVARQVSIHPALLASGLIVGIVGYIARHTGDAVDRAHVQTGNVARFSDESPSAVLRFSREGELLYANRSSAELLAHWGCVGVGQRLAAAECRWIAEIFRQGHSQEVEVACGQAVYALVVAPILEMGYVNIYGRDITRRKQAEELSRWKTALLEAQINATIDGILVVNGNNKRILTNRRMVELFEIPAHLMEVEDDAEWLAHSTERMKNPAAFLEKVRYLYDHPSETTHDEIEFQNGTILERYSAPVLGADGRNYGRIWTFRDVTARRRAEATERRRKALEESVAGMEQVLGIVAHELRTPLAGMRAISELLMDHTLRASDQCESFLSSLNQESIRMSETVEVLLEAARINSGRVEWNWGDVDLQAAGEAALAAVRPLVNAERIDLQLEVSPAGAHMAGDAHAVERLIINLVSNAQKHTLEGRIGVRFRVVEEAAMRWIELVVQDTGAGISPAIAQRLGEAFALSSGIVGANHVRGAGLGLAICKAIVAAHGGSIVVKSELGVGTDIIVRLRGDLPGPAQERVRVEFIDAAGSPQEALS